MLFMAVQTHGPRECPTDKKGAQSLYDEKNKKVKVRSIYRCGPAHRLYYVLEANDFGEVEKFFMKGMTRTVVDIKPVVAMK